MILMHSSEVRYDDDDLPEFHPDNAQRRRFLRGMLHYELRRLLAQVNEHASDDELVSSLQDRLGVHPDVRLAALPADFPPDQRSEEQYFRLSAQLRECVSECLGRETEAPAEDEELLWQLHLAVNRRHAMN